MGLFKPGRAVRIWTEGEVGDAWDVPGIIKSCGYLWIVQRWLHASHPENPHRVGAYECRSVLTGAVYLFFREEIAALPRARTKKGD